MAPGGGAAWGYSQHCRHEATLLNCNKESGWGTWMSRTYVEKRLFTKWLDDLASTIWGRIRSCQLSNIMFSPGTFWHAPFPHGWVQ